MAWAESLSIASDSALLVALALCFATALPATVLLMSTFLETVHSLSRWWHERNNREDNEDNKTRSHACKFHVRFWAFTQRSHLNFQKLYVYNTKDSILGVDTSCVWLHTYRWDSTSSGPSLLTWTNPLRRSPVLTKRLKTCEDFRCPIGINSSQENSQISTYCRLQSIFFSARDLFALVFVSLLIIDYDDDGMDDSYRVSITSHFWSLRICLIQAPHMYHA